MVGLAHINFSLSSMCMLFLESLEDGQTPKGPAKYAMNPASKPY